MDPVLFASFLAATLLIIATPGPSVAFAATQAVRHGPKAAMVATAGDALGTLVHIVIAVGSLQTLLHLSDLILPWLQIAGGLFIIYLAIRTLRSASAPMALTPPSGRTTFIAAFFACVSNPKAIVFFVALFPAFISLDHDIFFQTVVYGVIFIILDGASIIGYALLIRAAYRRAISPFWNVDVLSGLGLLGVGGFLVWRGWRALPPH
ncbi:MAG: LysE family translocator [Pseudomonadota bacterium]